MRRFLFLAAAGLILSTPPARADTLLLSFVGNNYGSVGNAGKLNNPYTTSDHVMGAIDITLASALMPDQSYYTTADPGNLLITIKDFSFNDGVQTLDNSNASIDFGFNTNTNGAIGFFELDVESQLNPGNDFIYVLRSSTHQLTEAELGSGNYGLNAASGVFTVTVTPEPSSLLLLGTGILGAAGMIRRRLA